MRAVAKPSTRVERDAQTHGLGVHLQSWRWTKYHQVVLGFVIGYLAVVYTPSWFKLLRDGWKALSENGFWSQLLVVGVVVLGSLFYAAFFVTAVYFLWGAITAAGRSLHLYQRGLVVARFGRTSVWRWQDLTDLAVERSSTPTTGSFSTSVTLTDSTGRKLVMDKRKAIGPISAAASRESPARLRVDNVESGGPDFPAHSGGPDD